MFRMDPSRLQRTVEQLQEAVRDHAEWLENLIRSVLCRLPPSQAELGHDAHRRCHLGEWYYGSADPELRQHPAFAAIEAEHVRVHFIAARILRAAAANDPIRREDYDELAACSARLRLELDSLRHEVQAALRSSDPLTGAYGRVEILPALREASELARRDVQQTCIAFMDLDSFKHVNDRHGHPVGDRVLASVVHHVATHLRPYDKIFRYGGDEFVILLPGTHLDDSHRLIDRIRAGLVGSELATGEDGKPLHVTVSFGLAQLEPDVDVEECIDRADKALLLAKASGRNRVACWDPSITTATLPDGVIRHAVDEGN